MLMLAKTLGKLSNKSRDVLIEVLSKIIEFYIEKKVEKDLEFSFSKVFKFKSG